MEIFVNYVVFLICFIVFVVSIIVLFKFVLNNRDNIKIQEYKYFREIPGNYGPEILGYLLTGNYMKREYMSASIMELIRRKIFVINKNKSGSYRISDNDINNLLYLSPSEKYLKDWLINDIGNGLGFDTDDLYISYFDTKKRENFEINFKEWSKIVIEMGKNENFFVNNFKFKYEVFYMLSSLLILFLPKLSSNRYVFLITAFLFSFNAFSFLYIYLQNPKTLRGKEEYAKWMGVKNYILEFSSINNRDILDVKLWDKYYVYAVSLEITDKLDNILLISDSYSIYDEDFFKKNIISLKREILKINCEIGDKKNIIKKILCLFDNNRI